MAKDVSLIPGLGRSPGAGNGNHSSILAWEIPRTESGGYSRWGHKESDTTERMHAHTFISVIFIKIFDRTKLKNSPHAQSLKGL